MNLILPGVPLTSSNLGVFEPVLPLTPPSGCFSLWPSVIYHPCQPSVLSSLEAFCLLSHHLPNPATALSSETIVLMISGCTANPNKATQNNHQFIRLLISAGLEFGEDTVGGLFLLHGVWSLCQEGWGAVNAEDKREERHTDTQRGGQAQEVPCRVSGDSEESPRPETVSPHTGSPQGHTSTAVPQSRR